MMRKALALLTVGVAALAVAAAAAAMTTGLVVIGHGRSSGDFAVTAASGHKSSAHALYLRGDGRGLSGMGVVACSRGIESIGSESTSLGHMTSGKPYPLRMPFAGDCDVTASLSGNGPIRVQILAR
jgi:hypothetical protein